jgi:hypothetical protein
MIFDTKDIEKPILVIVILILAAAIVYAGYNYGHVNTVTTPTVVTPTAVVTPVPTPTPDPSYLTNVVTVDAILTGSFPQVNIREDNRCFDVTYTDYDRLSVGDRVQFHVVSTYNPYGTVVYKTDYVNIVSHSWSNTHYYYYHNKYYRDDDDDHVTIEVTRDEAWEHDYDNEKPRHWRDD